MGYIFQSHKNVNMDDQKKITLHWINSIIRNNKCIFTKLNAVFILKTAIWIQKDITTVKSITNTWLIQQTPMFHGYTIANVNFTTNKTLSLETFDVMGPHQGFAYKLTFKLLKLFRKPVALLCDILM